MNPNKAREVFLEEALSRNYKKCHNCYQDNNIAAPDYSVTNSTASVQQSDIFPTQQDQDLPVERELEHIRLYVQLQNKSFQDKIHLDIHIDEKSKNLPILKIFLQPLVENSIVHGFQGTDETITIDIHTDDDWLSISVQDDGSGIEPQKLSWLRSGRRSYQFTANQYGYGLFNIQERIRNFYGESASMDFFSALSEGTTIRITLPLKNQATTQTKAY